MKQTEDQIRLLQKQIQQKENHYDAIALQSNMEMEELRHMYFDIKYLKTQLKLLMLQMKRQNSI